MKFSVHTGHDLDQTNECVVTADLLALTPIYRRIIDRYFA